ncbi:hypothetical protein ETD83_24210 [Actinomadura soli]|uniref:Uncharacterized protein n=1 Tax=Actinomadura soli TaxID=2508997 RepID=A0A5C4J722_9ACTN|nr:hypothetical protein [Actinomadura soli]TMQ94204.1 hypothetical protein ETD83_24210 [Actinomadura soli]
MGHDDRFRGQDPDYEFSRDDEPPPSSMNGFDESSMQQDQGGRPPVQDDGYVYGQDESPDDMGGGMRYRLPDEEGTDVGQEDEFGTYEDAPPDDDTEGNW